MERNTDPEPDATPAPGVPENSPEPIAPAAWVDTETEQVVLRRSPRYTRLIVLGAGVGAAAAFFASVLREPAQGYSQAQVFGFLLIFGIVFGGALGIIVALVLDKIARRGQRTLVANKLTVHVEEPPSTDVQVEASATQTASAPPADDRDPA